MVFPIASQQDNRATVSSSLLVPHSIQLQHRSFPVASELGEVLEETFELSNPTDNTVLFHLLPGACVHLFVDLGHSALLCAAASFPRCVSLLPGHTVYAIKFRCGCGSWLSHRPPASDRSASPQRQAVILSELPKTLAGCSDFPQRNAALLRSLSLQGGRVYQRNPLLRQCLELIEQRSGQIRVAEMAHAAGCSERHLHRLFCAQVGLNAKTCCQLSQLAASLHILSTAKVRSLLHLAVGCGYFDQAHMNRQYRLFLSTSANNMRRSIQLPLTPPLFWPANPSLQEDNS